MFLRATTRKKDGKEHRYFSVVENKRVSGGRVLQRHVLYLGEINSSQELAWRRSIEVLDEATHGARTLALFPEDRCEGVVPDESIVRLKLAQLRLERPRQWGACWLTLKLWQQLGLDEFWGERLAPSRKGTRFDQVLFVLVAYRLLSPGSEWRLHRHWFERSALGDLLGADAALADIHTLYACHDRLLEHKQAVFDHLVGRWRDLFNASFDVLLYDLTSTYFESDPPADDEDKRRHGYSRDHRPDCVQVVIALVVTPGGLAARLRSARGQYGRTRPRSRISSRASSASTAKRDACGAWIAACPPRKCSRRCARAIRRCTTSWARRRGVSPAWSRRCWSKPWHAARPGVQVKLLAQDSELYVFAESRDRIAKERSMRRRQLKWLWARLKKLSTMKLTRDALLMKLGAAQTKAPAAWRLIEVELTAHDAAAQASLTGSIATSSGRSAAAKGATSCAPTSPNPTPRSSGSSICSWSKSRPPSGPSKAIWRSGPSFTRTSSRIEAHIFIAFLAYCLHVTLGQQLKALAPGLTPRAVLEKFAAVQMIDVYVPTTDGRELSLTRYTQPEPELKLLLDKLRLTLPAQPPPKITAAELARATPM